MLNSKTVEWLGFTEQEYRIALDIIKYNSCKVNSRLENRYNISSETAKSVRYLCNIMTGKTNIGISEYMEIGDVRKLASHFRKMNNCKYKDVTLYDLERSKIIEVPRFAVIHGIEEEPYCRYNSKGLGDGEIYRVDKITQSNIVLRTSKNVALKYRQDRKYGIPDVISVVGKDLDGNTVLKVNKQYCRTCNRFVIVASLRVTDNHLGMYTLITKAGNIIYVYARNIEDSVKACSSKEKVYEYGIYEREIDVKLKNVAKSIYSKYGCIFYKKFISDIEYRLITKKVNDDLEDDLMI